MNFDDLLKYCMELNESSSDKCLICHIPIEKNDIHIKLKCTHIFHPECIKYTSGTVKCLYCDKVSTPYKINYGEPKNVKVKKSIKESISVNLPINSQNQLSCKVVLKTGPQKGNYCNRLNCNYHKLNNIKVQVINPVTKKIIKPLKQTNTNKPIITNNNCCTQIIKTGVKIGKQCGRNLPCKYHKINEQINNKPTTPIASTTDNLYLSDESDYSDDSDVIEV